MAFILKDRVKETTTSTGTSAISLGGTTNGFEQFQDHMANGDTTYYAIAHKDVVNYDEWEVGIATWNTGNTLTRSTVLASSNSNAAVDFTAGDKDVFMAYPASKAVFQDSNGDVDLNGGKLLFANVYSTVGDLPSASTYHGMFAHVHGTGKAYYAHGGNWIELVNEDTSGNVSMDGNLSVAGTTDINGGNIDGTTIGATTPAAGNFTDGDFTGNIELDGKIHIGDYVDFDAQASHPTHREGRLWYDNVHKTLNYHSDDTNVVHEIGLEEHQRVYNNTGSTIAKGKPLYFSGNYTAGTIEVPTVGLADATDVNAYNAQGLAASDIPDASYGYCIIAGQLHDVDTSALTAGTNFFVGLTPGAVQNASPTYPNFPMCLGWVVNSDATNGVLLVNQQNHSVRSFRVQTSAHIGTDLQVDGNLTVLGTTTSVSTSDVTAGAPFYRANEGDAIGEAGTTFSGSGLDDAFFSGHFTGTTSTTYYVKIDSVGTPDTFSVSTDNFATTISTGTAITGSEQLIHSADNIYVKFGATTGHTLNDVWTGTASPINVDTGFWSNRNTGTSGVGYTHMGIWYDASDSQWVLTDEYDPTPQGTINKGDSSYTKGTLDANLVGSVTGDVTGNLSGNVTGNLNGNLTAATTSANTIDIGIGDELTFEGGLASDGGEIYYYTDSFFGNDRLHIKGQREVIIAAHAAQNASPIPGATQGYLSVRSSIYGSGQYHTDASIAISSNQKGGGAVVGDYILLDNTAITLNGPDIKFRNNFSVGAPSSNVLTLTPATLTAAHTITLPDVTGTVATLENTQTFTAEQHFSDRIDIDNDEYIGWGGSTGRPAIRGNKTNNLLAFSIGGAERVNMTTTSLNLDVDLYLSDGRQIKFEGATGDAFETTLTVVDPTADRTLSLPDATGTVLLTDGDGSNLTGVLSDLVEDTSPQLGGQLDLNSQTITGTLDIDRNTDAVAYIGEAAIGYNGYSGVAAFGHIDMHNVNQGSGLTVDATSHTSLTGYHNVLIKCNSGAGFAGQLVASFDEDVGMEIHQSYSNGNGIRFDGGFVTGTGFVHTDLTINGTQTADRTIYLPDESGTLALEANVASTGKAIAMAIVFG